MKTEPSNITAGGVWLTDASGNKIGAVQQAQPDPMHAGCVDVHLSAQNPVLLSQGSGDWRVRDERIGTSYCVQALYAAPGQEGYYLRVSTLGEPTLLQEEYDEDYLLVEGQAPVRLKELLIADGQCAQGLHIRCELTEEDLRSVRLDFTQPSRCSCAKNNAGALGSAEGADAAHRWQFSDVAHRCEIQDETRPVTNIDIIRLKQRKTFHCRFHIGLPESECGNAVLIGHITSSESWA